MDRVASFSVSEHTTLFEDLHDRAAHFAGRQSRPAILMTIRVVRVAALSVLEVTTLFEDLRDH